MKENLKKRAEQEKNMKNCLKNLNFNMALMGHHRLPRFLRQRAILLGHYLVLSRFLYNLLLKIQELYQKLQVST